MANSQRPLKVSEPRRSTDLEHPSHVWVAHGVQSVTSQDNHQALIVLTSHEMMILIQVSGSASLLNLFNDPVGTYDVRAAGLTSTWASALQCLVVVLIAEQATLKELCTMIFSDVHELRMSRSLWW